MSLRKVKYEMESTDSSKVYKVARKYYLAKTGNISCVFCPYHCRENKEKKLQKSWKKFRKNQRKEFKQWDYLEELKMVLLQ